MLKRLNITLQCCIKNEAVSVTHQSVTTMQLWINLALALARGFIHLFFYHHQIQFLLTAYIINNIMVMKEMHFVLRSESVFKLAEAQQI